MLVGRRDELEVLRGHLADSRAVVLVGPAGIGKTTLARAALDQPRSGPGGYREAGALATLAWSPLLLFRRLLRDDPPELPDAVAAAVLAQASSPLLLDDVQWCDDASLDVMGRLIGRTGIVATVRTGEERSDLVLEVLDLVGAARVDLGGLPPESAAALAVALHPGLSEPERAQLVATAEGNPLLLTELPRGPVAAPTLVSALIGRLQALSPDARVAAERLAVLGRPAELDLLGSGVDELVVGGLVGPARDGRVTISHSLLGEVIVEGMGERADVVRRELVGFVPVGEGAHLLAAAGDRAGARALALQAAEVGDRRRRATMLAFAVSCADDLDVEHRVRAARLFTSVSEPGRAQALCDVPGLADLDRVDRGALLAVQAEATWLQGRQRESLELAEQALSELRGTRTAYEAAVLAGSTVAQTFVDLDGRPALERAREAVRLADEIGAEQGYTRTRLASVLMTSGEPGWAELYQEVIDLANASDDDDLRRTAVVSLILGQWASGNPAAAKEAARVELTAGPRQALDLTWLSIASYAAVLGLVTGRSRVDLIAEFRPLLEQWPVFRSRPFMEAAVTLALADSGQHGAAADLAAGSLERSGGDGVWQSLAWWARTDASWLAGRLEEAVAGAEAVIDLGLGDYPSAVQARLAGAHAARELGRPAVGPAPGSLQPAWQTAPVEWAALATADGDPDGAVAGLLEAAEGWRTNDIRAEVRCRWAAGDVAARAGQPGAQALLEAAEARALELGLAAMVDRIRRSLRSIGVVRRAAGTSGATGLTAREEQVLDLVGTGARSADIAAALGVEVSTVESFVRTAMQKLSVPTRVAAAARLRELRAGPGPSTG